MDCQNSPPREAVSACSEYGQFASFFFNDLPTPEVTFAMMVMFSVAFVCSFVCLYVSNLTGKVMDGFH